MKHEQGILYQKVKHIHEPVAHVHLLWQEIPVAMAGSGCQPLGLSFATGAHANKVVKAWTWYLQTHRHPPTLRHYITDGSTGKKGQITVTHGRFCCNHLWYM